MMRTCTGCRQEKSADEFYSHAAKCKVCIRARVSKWRADNIERQRAYDRARAKRPARREHINQCVQKWKTDNPEWRRAQTAVSNGIRDGSLVRPRKCSRCRAGGRIEAHHHDYNKPLVVEWLCKPCHAVADKERRGIAA